MKWTDEAEAAIKKVPFFLRKKVRARVEKEAAVHMASVFPRFLMTKLLSQSRRNDNIGIYDYFLNPKGK